MKIIILALTMGAFALSGCCTTKTASCQPYCCHKACCAEKCCGAKCKCGKCCTPGAKCAAKNAA